MIDINKRVLIWRFTLVLIKINYGQIGDPTGFFYTTNPVFYTSGNRLVHRTGTFGYLWFFHLSRRTTVIQDLLVRCQFSLVPDNRTNVNVNAWVPKHERICNLCGYGIGDEFHYLFICEKQEIKTIREKFIPIYYTKYPTELKLSRMLICIVM